MKDIKKSQQVQNKREKEKQIVDLMIHLYCRKNIKLWKNIMDCARSVKNSETMPQCVWINVRLWRQRHSAVTAGYIVTSRR